VLTTIHSNIWLGIHLTRLSTEGLGPRHGEVRRAHQMLNAALSTMYLSCPVRKLMHFELATSCGQRIVSVLDYSVTVAIDYLAQLRVRSNSTFRCRPTPAFFHGRPTGPKAVSEIPFMGVAF